MPEQEQSLGIQDLRAIIHGLRMNGFAFVEDEGTKDQIVYLIEELPSPEQLDSMIENPVELKHIQERVGEIMRLVELGGRRDENFKIRYESKKDMPPRYKVLKWRTAMNNKVLTKNLIKASVYADDRSEPTVADQAIRLAGKVKDGTVTQGDVESFESAFEASSLHQEAALSDWWAGMKGGLGGAWQGAKNVGHQFADPAKTNAALAKSRKFMENINKNVAGLIQSLGNAHSFVAPYNTGMAQSIQQMLSVVNGFQANAGTVLENLNGIELQLKQTTVPGGPQGAPAEGGPAAPAEGGQALPQGSGGEAAQSGGSTLFDAIPDPDAPMGSVNRNQPQPITPENNPATNVQPSEFEGDAPAAAPTNTPTQLDPNKPMPNLMDDAAPEVPAAGTTMNYKDRQVQIVGPGAEGWTTVKDPNKPTSKGYAVKTKDLVKAYREHLMLKQTQSKRWLRVV